MAYRLLNCVYNGKKIFSNLHAPSLRKILSCKCCQQFDENVDYARKRNILELEIDILKQEGVRVPSMDFLEHKHWEQIYKLNSKSARRKYLAFLWQIENKKLKKIEKSLRNQKNRIRGNSGDELPDCLIRNKYYLKIYDSTMNIWDNNRLIQAMQFGSKLIFDCSYNDDMTKRESINAAKQLMLCFATNRAHIEPYDLHFCNVNNQDITLQYLRKHIPTIHEPWFPVNLHEKCFTNIFPKEKLVYLTPHCKNDLEYYDYDNIYVIGCMVDKVNNEPLSLAKAKKLGLKMARLPLEKYLSWRPGSGKSLTLNQMTDILLDFKVSGDWNLSLKHVPKRKMAHASIEHLLQQSTKIKV